MEEYQQWSTWSEWPQEPAMNALPSPPPLPDGKQIYKPHWVYGSQWPNNTAPTTLILQNLPHGLTQDGLIQVLDEEGFNGLYDFVFLPSCLRTGRAARFAIINLLRHSYGISLASHCHGRMDWGVDDANSACRVKWSLPVQGLEEVLETYRNDITMHPSVPEHLRPALFNRGFRIPMPAPTRHIRPPRSSNDKGPVRSAPTKQQQEVEDVPEHDLRIDLKSEWPSLGC